MCAISSLTSTFAISSPDEFLYSPVAGHHRTLAGTRFRPAEGRRLSWRGWLITYRGDMPARRRSPIPVLTGLDVK